MTLFKQIEKQETAARDFGFYWETIDQLLDQIRSECTEVHEAHQKTDLLHLEEEIGDLIHATICLAIFCKIAPQKALHRATNKIQKRFDKVFELAKKEGHKTLHGHSFDQLMYYWDQAKK